MNEENIVDREESSQSIDAVFDALSARRRRFVLTYLVRTADGTADLHDVVEYVLRREREPHEEISPERRHRITSSLHHNHLPRLDRAGVLAYDATSGTIRYRGDPFIETLVTLLRDG